MHRRGMIAGALATLIAGPAAADFSSGIRDGEGRGVFGRGQVMMRLIGGDMFLPARLTVLRPGGALEAGVSGDALVRDEQRFDLTGIPIAGQIFRGRVGANVDETQRIGDAYRVGKRLVVDARAVPVTSGVVGGEAVVVHPRNRAASANAPRRGNAEVPTGPATVLGRNTANRLTSWRLTPRYRAVDAAGIAGAVDAGRAERIGAVYVDDGEMLIITRGAG